MAEQISFVELANVFLAPSTILAGALGVAKTEALKTGVSAAGLGFSIIRGLCCFSEWNAKQPFNADLLGTLPLGAIALWFVAVLVHWRSWRNERAGSKAPDKPV